MSQAGLRWILFFGATAAAIGGALLMIANSGAQGLSDHWATRSPTSWFIYITVSVFVLNTLMVARQILKYDGLRELCNKHVGDGFLRELSNSESKQESVTQGGLAVDRLLDELGESGVIIAPLRNRLKGVQDSIRKGKQEAAFVRNNLLALGQRIEEPPSLRFVNQALVNLLLFTGIIGTFFGLIQFVSSPELAGVLVKLSEGAGLQDAPTGEIFRGFETSFGSSLIAYLSYLVGRLHLDITDETYDVTAGHVVSQVQDGLARALSFGGEVKAVVALDEESRKLLDDTAKQLAESVRLNDELSVKLGASIDELTSASTQLTRAMQNADGVADKMMNAMRTGEAAAKGWRETTNKFTERAESFLNTLLMTNDTLIEQTAEQKTQGQELLKGMDDMLQSVRVEWSAGMKNHQELIERSADRYHKSLATFAESWSKQVADYEKTKKLLTGTIQQVERLIPQASNSISDSLAGVSDEVSKAVASMSNETGTALDAVRAAQAESSKALTDALDDWESKYQASAAQIRDVLQRQRDQQHDDAERLTAGLESIGNATESVQASLDQLMSQLGGPGANESLPAVLADVRQALRQHHASLERVSDALRALS